MSSRKRIERKQLASQASRVNRVPSNFFTALDQSQIRLFKEAFNIIDQDRNGIITRDDLRGTLSSLGQKPTFEEIDDMMEGKPSFNFTSFLSMFGLRMANTDPEDIILRAFSCLDDGGDGKLSAKMLRELLTTMGQRMKYSDVTQLFDDVGADQDGNLDYVKLVRLLKNGANDQ
ncbi:predicted protein, partial [Nematostella vectensis]